MTPSQGFWLGKYEVTQEQWESVMGSTPWSGSAQAQANPSHPAVYISWYEVRGFIDRLNEAAGEDLYHLPTEAEWEYACRAGTSTIWYFGDDEGLLADHAWYFDNAWGAGLQHAQPVGTKLANPWSLFDMHGNVKEWCHDWSAAWYTTDPQVDPSGPSTGSERVFRSGSFGNGAEDLRSTSRTSNAPDHRSADVGVRLVLMGPPPTAVTPQTWGKMKSKNEP